MITVEELEPKGIGQQKVDIQALVESPGWNEHLLPEIKKLHAKAVERATERGVAHEARAEWIEAVHVLAELMDYPETKLADLKLQWKNFQKPSPTA